MRIGIFTETYEPYISGLVTSEIMLKNALEKQGHEVYVVTANLESFKYEYDEKKRVLKIPGIPTGIYDSRLSSIYPVRAVNKIKSWKLDVIHSQTEFAIGTFARIFAKQYNIPLVHTYHTMYEDYIYYITKGYFEKSSKKLLAYFTRFYEVERFFKENIKKDDCIELKKTLKIDKKDFVLLFVGRLAEEKNVEFLIKCQQKINQKHKNIKLLIVGDGPGKEEYEGYTKKLGLNKNIIFTGKTAWGEIPYYYHIANAFVTASKTETQGLTIIEAMASNVVPVCMRDEAFQSMVTEELNGLFFETEEEYINSILKLFKNREELEKLSKQARIQAETYSSKYYGEKVLEVYNRAIKEKQKENKYGIISKIVKIIKEKLQ